MAFTFSISEYILMLLSTSTVEPLRRALYPVHIIHSWQIHAKLKICTSTTRGPIRVSDNHVQIHYNSDYNAFMYYNYGNYNT